MTSHRGEFVWYELMTTDTAAAQAFYGKVVGWGMMDSGLDDRSYTLLTVNGVPSLGMMGLTAAECENGMRPAWMGYVASPDVDAQAASFKTAGGALYFGPEDIPEVGRFAMAGDPQGAAIGLFKAGGMQEPPAFAPDTPGRVGWRELMAGDMPAVFEFYAREFGWTKAEAHDMGPMGVYQLFAAGGEAIGGMMTKPPQIPAPFWQYYFNVETIRAAADRVTSAGGTVLMGPAQVPGGQWIIQALDPQGAAFGLVAPRE
jgi:predicted enzyme related to lactoylglutathione lyase